MRAFDKYCCPKCAGELVKNTEEEIFCSKCADIFRIRNGIPDFLGEENALKWKLSDDAVKLIDLSDRIGWKNAVRQVYGESNFERWVMDYSRGNGCLITSINPDSIVLDAGCGLGAISFFLAKICKEVHSFDFLFEYLQFLKTRAIQDRAENIFPVRGEFMRLPFRKNCFDLIICNDILRYMPVYYAGYPPKDTAVEVLRKFNQILKPGGEICLGIENRFALRYCLGAKGEHTGLRFITVLPRYIANFYSKLIKGEEYRHYAYSYKQLKGLFQKANFKIKEVYMPVKSHRDIKFLIDLQEPQSFVFALQLMKRKFMGTKGLILEKIVKTAVFFRFHYLYLHKFFSPSFSIIAEKQEKQGDS